MGLTRAQRDELDRRVQAIDWTDEARAFGSPQRQELADWMLRSGMVEEEIRKSFRNPAQAERMLEYTQPRMVEKVTGVPIVSNPAQWNTGNILDPQPDWSFCGWVRHTTYAISHRNARRVLHPPVKDTTSYETMGEDEDDARTVFDRADTRPLTPTVPNLFDAHPGLWVLRPDPPQATMMRGQVARYGTGIVPELIYGTVLDNPQYRQMEPGDVAALLLTPLPKSQAPVAVALTPPAYRRLMAAWVPGQLTVPRAMDGRAIRRELDMLPGGDIRAWRVLGTVVARLVV